MSNKISHVFRLPNFAFCFGLYHKYFTAHNPIFWQYLRFLAKNGIILMLEILLQIFSRERGAFVQDAAKRLGRAMRVFAAGSGKEDVL